MKVSYFGSIKVCSGVHQRKRQISALLTLCVSDGIHRSSVDSPHKGSVTDLMSPCFGDFCENQIILKSLIAGRRHLDKTSYMIHRNHYSDVIMGAMASQITSLIIVYLAVYSGADERKHQSSASLAFVQGIHRWPVNSPHKWPVTRKTFPFDDVIMFYYITKYVFSVFNFLSTM